MTTDTNLDGVLFLLYYSFPFLKKCTLNVHFIMKTFIFINQPVIWQQGNDTIMKKSLIFVTLLVEWMLVPKVPSKHAINKHVSVLILLHRCSHECSSDIYYVCIWPSELEDAPTLCSRTISGLLYCCRNNLHPVLR